MQNTEDQDKKQRLKSFEKYIQSSGNEEQPIKPEQEAQPCALQRLRLEWVPSAYLDQDKK